MFLVSLFSYLLFFFFAFLLIGKIKEDDQYGSSFYLLLLGFLLSLFSGIRYFVGRDYPVYLSAYREPSSNHFAHLEPLWQWFINFLRGCGAHFGWFTLITSALFVFLVLRYLKRESASLVIALLTFLLVYRLYFESFNTVRQCIAQAICLFSLPLFRDRRYLATLVILFFAYLVHHSSLVFALLLPLLFVHYHTGLIVGVLLFSITIGPHALAFLFQHSSSYSLLGGGKYILYFTSPEWFDAETLASFPSIWFIFNTAMALYFLWRQKDWLTKDEKLLPYLNAFYIAALIANCLVFSQPLGRIMYYPYFFLPILLSRIYQYGTLIDRKMVMAVLALNTIITLKEITDPNETFFNYKTTLPYSEAKLIDIEKDALPIKRERELYILI